MGKATNTCGSCKADVDAWNARCDACGFRLVLEPAEAQRARFLRGPALGALLFTQGWTFGARLYLLGLFSLIPVVGFVVLFASVFFGRRLSWKYGGWSDWEGFQTRMRRLDLLGLAWVLILLGAYFFARSRSG